MGKAADRPHQRLSVAGAWLLEKMAELPEPPQEKYMPLKRGFSLEDNLSRQADEIEVLNSILEGDVEIVREKEEFRVSLLTYGGMHVIVFHGPRPMRALDKRRLRCMV